MATINVLSAQSLASIIVRSLPRDANPQIKNVYDAIALAAHAAMIAVGFRLIGLGEDDKSVESSWTDVRPLPDNWNVQSPANYSFRYAHSQSAMEFLVKVNRLGNKAVILGMGIGADKTITFDVKVDEYTSANSVPTSPSAAAADVSSTQQESQSSGTQSVDGKSAEPSTEAKQKVLDIFISQGRLADFGALARLRMIQKLIPSLHKEGYEETTEEGSRSATTTTSSSTRHQQPRAPPASDPQPARPHPYGLDDPLRMPPRQPRVPPGDFAPPGFEDEHEILRPPRPLGGPGPGGPGLGQRDLYPQGLGPNDPFRPMGPGLGGIGGGGGMHPTFDDPLFRGQGRTGGDGDDGFGYDGQAPPGARYDPVGPGGAPRGAGGGGRGGFGGPPNPFGGFGSGDFI